MHYVARQPALRAAVGYWTVTGIATAGLVPALTYFLTVDQGHGDDALGFVLSGYAIGSLVGSLLAAQLTQRRLGILFLAGTGTAGLILTVVSAGLALPAQVGLAFLFGTVNSVGLIAYVTIRASLTPDELLGRVGATARMLSIGLQPIGAAVAGVLLDTVAGGQTLRLMGLIVVGASIAFAFVGPLRNAREPRAERAATAPN
jgi:MFS family permease